jgi:hypothetical protein
MDNGAWKMLYPGRRDGCFKHLADYWPEWLPDVPPAQGIRYGATETLKMLGPDAKQAVADLIRLLPDSRGSSHYDQLYRLVLSLVAAFPAIAPAMPRLLTSAPDSHSILALAKHEQV